MKTTRSDWQLPTGVSPGTWDYAQKASIADEYDEYFGGHPLFQLDQGLVTRHIPPPEMESLNLLADLGCGTGRALIPLVRMGYRGLAIDLSQSMLEIVRRKAQDAGLGIVCLRANLVELDGIRNESVDHAVSLFSTLGMIRGRASRRQSLAHVRRILKPDGRFIVHVHNTWSALYDPDGPRWLFDSWKRSTRKGEWEFGDRVYQYRGLPNMFLHNYRLAELKADLRSVQFVVDRIYPINATASQLLRLPAFLPRLRAGGFIAVCRK